MLAVAAEAVAVAPVVAAAAAADSSVVPCRFADCLGSDLLDDSRSDEDFEPLVLDLSDGRDFASVVR